MKQICILLCLLLSSCSVKNMVPKLSVVEISFGSGGGITGAVSTYKLTANGDLSFQNQFLKNVESELTTQLFLQAESLLGYKYYQPDNFYYFLEIKTQDGTNRIVWGSSVSEVNPKVLELHQSLTKQGVEKNRN